MSGIAISLPSASILEISMVAALVLIVSSAGAAPYAYIYHELW